MRLKVLLVVFFCVLFFSSCERANTAVDIGTVIGTNQMKTEYMSMSYMYDYHDINTLVSTHSYIFVGKVEEYVKTKSDSNNATTFYSVRVLNNIKGSLQENINVTLTKIGGLKADSDCFIVLLDDILPKVGGTYIFSTYVADTSDDELLCYGPCSAVEVDAEDYLNSELYKEYVEALNNPIELLGNTDYLSTLSAYDINYPTEIDEK